MTGSPLAGVRVLAVTPRLWPTWGAGTQRTTALIAGLLEAGAEVSALVATTAAADDWDRPPVLERVDLHVGRHAWANLPWQVHHALLAVGARDPLAAAHRRLARLASRRHADVVVCSGPPWSGVEVASQLATELGLPFVADLRDEWSGNPFQRWVGPFYRSLARRRETHALARARLVTAPFPAVFDALHRPPEGMAMVLGHGCDTRLLLDTVGSPPPLKSDEPLRLLFAGARYGLLNEARFLTTAARVGRLLPPIHLQLVGAARPLAASAPPGMTVEIVPHVDHGTLMRYYDRAHALLALLPRERGPGCVPSKLEEYRATGRPILAFAVAGGALAVAVAGTAGGYSVAEDDPDALGDALLALRQSCETPTDFRSQRVLRDWSDLGREWAAAIAEHGLGMRATP